MGLGNGSQCVGSGFNQAIHLLSDAAMQLMGKCVQVALPVLPIVSAKQAAEVPLPVDLG
jgi:hypothetical protein